MQKKLLCLFITICTLLCACGNTTTNNNMSNNTDDTPLNAVEEIDKSKPIDIILPMLSLNGETIDAYVAALATENPSETYSVYNEEYYIQTITEGERLEILETFSSSDVLNDTLENLQSDEQLFSIFVKIEADELYQNFKVYVNKDAYEQNIFAVQFVIPLTLSVISQSCQAYSLVLPEDRVTEIKYVDNATGEELE